MPNISNVNRDIWIKRRVEALGNDAIALSRQIHGFAEPAFKEKKSSRLIADYLQTRGFDVRFPYRAMPTAIRAEWGKSGPCIGLLGEYDALPNCGVKPGDWGHGCGHNLLGVAPALAAVVAAEYLKQRGMKGRIVYYGTPAEETLCGKPYMARDGAFRELDAAIAWHPLNETGVNLEGGAAMDSIVYEFIGTTAHAAGNPHEGRSALDAATLMNSAVEFLREHVPENVRIHYVVQEGGDAPNVVPAYAKLWYYIRGVNRKQVDEVKRRVDDCARGAALAAGVKTKITRLSGIYERLPNVAISQALMDVLKRFRTPKASADDVRRARKLGLSGGFAEKVSEQFGSRGRASSDEDSVSWLAPLGQFNMAAWADGTPLHNRMLSAQMAYPFAEKALLRAAMVETALCIELCANSKLLHAIRMEFKKKTRGFRYDPLVGKHQPVPGAEE